jgi:hypothetical protein
LTELRVLTFCGVYFTDNLPELPLLTHLEEFEYRCTRHPLTLLQMSQLFGDTTPTSLPRRHKSPSAAATAKATTGEQKDDEKKEGTLYRLRRWRCSWYEPDIVTIISRYMNPSRLPSLIHWTYDGAYLPFLDILDIRARHDMLLVQSPQLASPLSSPSTSTPLMGLPSLQCLIVDASVVIPSKVYAMAISRMFPSLRYLSIHVTNDIYDVCRDYLLYIRQANSGRLHLQVPPITTLSLNDPIQTAAYHAVQASIRGKV